MTAEKEALSLVRMSLLMHNPNEVDLDADGNMIVTWGGRDFLMELKAFEVSDA